MSRNRGAAVVLERIAAAIFGGYALANLLPIVLARWLPGARADAVLTGLLLSFVVYVVAILWAFAAPSRLCALAPHVPGWSCCCPVCCWAPGR